MGVTLPDTKILEWTKYKAFASNKLNIAEIRIFLLSRVENN